MTFCERNYEHNTITIKHRNTNRIEVIRILDVIPFTTKRKRMTVIIELENGKIYLCCKGSDSTVLPLCFNQYILLLLFVYLFLFNRDNYKMEINSQIDKYTLHAYRTYHFFWILCLKNIFVSLIQQTLVYGHKELTQEEYEEWKKNYENVKNNTEQIELMKCSLYNEIEALENEIENHLELSGVIGLEDRLQDGVENTIKRLLEAGIKMWLITGDKGETAKNIAVYINSIWFFIVFLLFIYIDCFWLSKWTWKNNKTNRREFEWNVKR